MTGDHTAAAERGEMVLRAYDPDDRQRLVRILVDLHAWADKHGLDFPYVAAMAHQRAELLREQEEIAQR